MSAGPWLSKHNFLGLGSIEFKVIGVGPLFDMLDLGCEYILKVRTEFISNEIGIKAAINLSAFISNFKFGPPNFPESSAVLLKESLVIILYKITLYLCMYCQL